ncbi:hypothetical protein BT96DRAFT_1023328 [Gymnopus androsaceus JB14]|uniref:F-box domain-containing protein n=1 Tax=Gymnopus androsaceus JB14 TaxID=1447944 RepID=A0A6A4H594_9AGAR|nr:hypothetical protein BT96DRAFT_1023328 [Gymnopus androsaceus JB14]
MLLSDLPSDILILVLDNVLVSDLSALSRTSTLFYNLVNNFGWQIHVRSNPRPSFSLSASRQVWHPRTRLRYDTLSDKSWSSSRFVARPLSHPWSRKQQPTLAINDSRLVVAAGNTIYSYAFGTLNASGSPPLQFEGSFPLRNERNSQWDITALAFVHDNGQGRTLMCGFRNGTLARVLLVNGGSSNTLTAVIDMEVNHQPHARDIIESISSSNSLYLSLSSRGKAYLSNLQSPHTYTSHVDLATRSWTTYISTEGTPYAAFGSSSATSPLSVYSILEDSFSHTPTAILGTKSSSASFSSAVYGICRAPCSSPWGSSPQILISGWYDGQVRVHDLRSSSLTESYPNSGSDSGSPAPLRPVMSLNDPWSIEPVYSVSSGGGASSYLGAGSARHSVVSFWDVRYPKAGWSVYAPGNDRSPVYSVLLESSRVFGATDSRPFVYDFGPNVTKDTYPQLSPSPGLRPRRSNAGYYVTRYSHGHGSLLNDH